MEELPSLANLQPMMRVPPHPSVVDSNTKIIKIKQPWASAIVEGEKDVENRKWRLSPECGPGTPMWFVVASSKSKPTRSLMEDYKSRLGLDSTTLIDNSQFKFGAMIGVVKLRGCYNSWPSVWYNADDIAWVIEQAWEFETPIEMDEYDKMQTQGSLGADARAKFGYVEKVRDEIVKLM